MVEQSKKPKEKNFAVYNAEGYKKRKFLSVPGKGFFVDNPDREYLAEKRNVSMEEDLIKVIEEARSAGQIFSGAHIIMLV